MMARLFLFLLLCSSSLMGGIIHRKSYPTVCDFSITSFPSKFNPAQMSPGCSVYVQKTCLDEFFQEVFPQIQTPFVLVTAVGIGNIDETYLPYLESNLVLHWFATLAGINHPKLTALPLGVPERVADESTFTIPTSSAPFFAPKPNSIFVNWRNTHPVRRQLTKYFKQLDGAFVCGIVPFQVYLNLIAESRFIISPPGIDPDCYRTWETLYLGSIPVVGSYETDQVYADLPVIIVPDLGQVTESSLEAALTQLEGQTFNWQKLNLAYWANQFSSFR